jgi:2'-5' RNA ligase
VTSVATLEGNDRLRLFVALVLPERVSNAIAAWGTEHLSGGRILDHFHVTLAFLGSRPRSELDGIVGALRDTAAAAEPFDLEIARYRETRSVGMLVLADPSGGATALAESLHVRLEELGSYRREARPWLPHVTVLRFRTRQQKRPGLDPPVAPLRGEIGVFAPSEAAAFLSRLHRSGARYEILARCQLSQSTPREARQGG